MTEFDAERVRSLATHEQRIYELMCRSGRRITPHEHDDHSNCEVAADVTA